MNDTHETVRRLRSETSTLRAKVRDLQASLTELAPAPREQATSETEGEKGTELRPCDFTGHMALTAEVARLRTSLSLMDDEVRKITADRDHRIANLWDVIEANGATNSRLMRERDAARVELADVRTRLAERDAAIVRLTKRLSEGLG